MCVLLLQLLSGLKVRVNKGAVRYVCCQTGTIVVFQVTRTSDWSAVWQEHF